jgi:hypothetical protein
VAIGANRAVAIASQSSESSLVAKVSHVVREGGDSAVTPPERRQRGWDLPTFLM